MSRTVVYACLFMLLALPRVSPAASAEVATEAADPIRLGKTLLQTRSREEAREMVDRLTRIRTPLARQALLLHVKRKGLADREAFASLREAPLEERLPTWMARAASPLRFT